MCQYLVVQYPMNHQKYVSVSSYMVHMSDVSSCTVQLDTDTYFWCLIVYSTTIYSRWNIRNMVAVPSFIVHEQTSEICVNIKLYSTRLSIIYMCQYLVIWYMMKHQIYVPVSRYCHHISDVSSCTVQLDTATYFWCFIVYCTTRHCHICLMFHRVLYNKILTHISDLSPVSG
jgi:hypothetical protein